MNDGEGVLPGAAVVSTILVGISERLVAVAVGYIVINIRSADGQKFLATGVGDGRQGDTVGDSPRLAGYDARGGDGRNGNVVGNVDIDGLEDGVADFVAKVFDHILASDHNGARACVGLSKQQTQLRLVGGAVVRNGQRAAQVGSRRLKFGNGGCSGIEGGQVAQAAALDILDRQGAGDLRSLVVPDRDGDGGGSFFAVVVVGDEESDIVRGVAVVVGYGGGYYVGVGRNGVGCVVEVKIASPRIGIVCGGGGVGASDGDGAGIGADIASHRGDGGRRHWTHMDGLYSLRLTLIEGERHGDGLVGGIVPFGGDGVGALTGQDITAIDIPKVGEVVVARSLVEGEGGVGLGGGDTDILISLDYGGDKIGDVDGEGGVDGSALRRLVANDREVDGVRARGIGLSGDGAAAVGQAESLDSGLQVGLVGNGAVGDGD